MPAVQGTVTMLLTNAAGTTALAAGADASEAFVETKSLDMGDGEAIKFADELRVEIDQQISLGNMTALLKHHDNLNDALASADSSSLSTNSPYPLRPPDAAFYRIRFEDTGVTALWKLSKFEVFGGVSGRKS